jgi:hypothetical protein
VESYICKQVVSVTPEVELLENEDESNALGAGPDDSLTTPGTEVTQDDETRKEGDDIELLRKAQTVRGSRGSHSGSEETEKKNQGRISVKDRRESGGCLSEKKRRKSKKQRCLCAFCKHDFF